MVSDCLFAEDQVVGWWMEVLQRSQASIEKSHPGYVASLRGSYKLIGHSLPLDVS